MRYLKAAALTAGVLVVVGAIYVAGDSRGWFNFLKPGAAGAAAS